MRLFKYLLISSLFLSMSFASTAKNSVTDLRCEYHENPVGIDIHKPRLSWKIISDRYNVEQTAYEIRVARSSRGLSQKALLWSSGKVNSSESIHIPYDGQTLKSGERAYWQVRIWDHNNKVSAWSSVNYWEVGILNNTEWKASWITMKDAVSKSSLPSQYYRNEFKCEKKIESARVYVSSLGLYQLFINGVKVGDQLFTPGFTSYKKRVQYQTYDVTHMIEKDNAIGAIVGDGWYRGYLGWDGDKAYYGDQLALIAQVQINYTDGSQQTIVTDKSWSTSYGAITESDIYNGEKYDARKEQTGWSTISLNDSGWHNVQILNHPKEILVASNGQPVRAIEEITPIAIITTPKGEKVLDLGQNIVGYARMKVKGNSGDMVTLQFAEVLDKEGNFYTTNLRSADATDTYTLKGGGEEIYEPHFTFHGFRYIKLMGYPEPITKDKITGIVIHSDMESTGHFHCSDSLINQLQSNIQWGQRDNFLDIPTDCPQRDERVGWTGDTQVFSMTAAFNYGVAPFYRKWLEDLALDQRPDGEVPNVIPDMWNNKLGGCSGWADAAVIVPWTVYKAYGDVRILEHQYLSMKKWVDYVTVHAGDDYLWNERRHQWGDWLSFHSDKAAYPGAYTETDLIATAYFYYSTSLMEKIAVILDKKGDANEFNQLANNIKSAFQKEFITPSGRLVSHTQTAYAMALSFDLMPEDMRSIAAAHFAKQVRKFKHLTTGFLGTPLLCSTLSDTGYDQLAFMLLNRKEYPSWLYPVTMGATTIWERWDTQKPDGTIIEGMNSFNHYSYGAIGEWLYSYVAGLKIDEDTPGYKHILLHPHPGGGLTHAEVDFVSMYGAIKSSWNIHDDNFVYQVVIPTNTSATVTLPKAQGCRIVLNDDIFEYDESKCINKDVIVELGSGSYTFVYRSF